MEYRGLAFRLLGRAACTVEAMLRMPHDMFPTKLFLAVGDPEVGAALADSDACSLDDFSKASIAKFGLQDEVDQGALRRLALMIYVDIVQIEQRHAALRWRLKVMVATNVLNVRDLSAQN